MRCVILASGDLDMTPEIEEILKRADIIICADGGARHLGSLNLKPHFLIGDMDSISAEDMSRLDNNQTTIIRHPVKKDQTDSELSIDLAFEQGASDITFLGAIGSRMDHTLANIFLLRKLSEKKISGCIINMNNKIYLTRDFISLKGKPKDNLSIIPLTETVKGITLTGLEYNLTDGQMEMGSSLGISNRFTGDIATITIHEGWVAVIQSKD